MANTYIDYPAGAGDQEFNFNFDYLLDSHVVVTIDNVTTTAFTISTTPRRVILNTPLASAATVRVKRVSDPTTNLVDFVNGSVLNEKDLDDAYLHNRYLNEEASEGSAGEQLSKQGGDHYDADGAKITDLSDPTDAQDAATKNYVDSQDFADRAYIDALGLDHFDGSNLSSNVDMNNHRLTNIGEALSPSDVSSRSYVSNSIDEATLGTGATPGVSRHTGTGSETDFILSFAANHSNSSSYLVTVNGLVQDPEDYAVVGGTNLIRFTTAPALSADIVIVERGYRSAFSEIPSDYDYGSIVGTTDSFYDYGSVA